MVNSATGSIEHLETAGRIGVLLVVAGILSIVIYALYGRWPAGYGGWVAAIFGLVGIGLVGYSLVAKN